MTQLKVEKYRKSIRVLHWVHTVAFVSLFLTGLVLFIPQLGFLAQDSWTRVIHRIAAVAFIIAPLIYITLDFKGAVRGIKEAFTWGSEDLGWLKAAPTYYFLGDERGMPPQGSMNTGQKLWWFIVIVFGVVFIITGLLLWFGKSAIPAELMLWTVFIHDVAFIVSGAMLFVHVYLGILHPMMTEAWSAMSSGKISTKYAKTHHGKWYAEISKSKES